MGARAKLLLLAIAHAITTAKHTDTGGIEDSLLDGVSIVSYQPLGDVNSGEYINSHVVVSNSETYALAFSPPKLTFGARPLGMPHIERVTIMNKLNRTVHLTSISGHTTHFHSSFFEDKSIPPNGNTSFNVVFLGRMEGPVDTCLFIHTSEGIHKYMMSGISTPSAYRLQPLMRIFLPYNASYSSLIHMHNPHDYPIQVTEVYSSGGNVLLELPGGGLEGPQTLWLLPPHTTRPVITIRYNPPLTSSTVPHQLPVQDKESPTHHTAYVRIKLHGTASVLSSVLVVAVEIITAPEAGPYTVPQLIDFGLGGTKDPPKKIRIFMGNSSPKPVRISTITADNAEVMSNGGLRILTTAKTLLPPFSPPDIHVATIILNWKQSYDSGQCCGKIIITTKQDHTIEIPYTSEPLNGGLIMNDESVTRYLTSESGITVIRQVLLKNTFKVGVYATELILGKGIDKYFEISAFYPQDFKVNTIQHGFRIQLKSWTKSLKFESKLTIVTNVSSQVIPVYIYNGKLDIVSSIPPRPSNKGVLDLGLVGVSSTTRATLVLRNSNPVPVCIRDSGADLPGTAVQLLGCTAQPPSALELASGSTSNVTACTCIPAKWCAILIVSVVAPASAASLRGEFWVATVHERLIVPVALTAANGGRLSQPEPSTFEDCFPGTLCSFPLQIKSTFPVDMDVVSVEAVPYDRRLYYKRTHEYLSKDVLDSSSTIVASALSKIGWLHYDPYLLCDGKCYSGLDVNSTVGQQWISKVTLTDDTLDFDIRLLNSRYNLFLNLTSLSPSMNLSIRLDTTQVRNHMLSTSIPFVWPKLYKSTPTILAPLAQVGRPSYFHFKIINPSHARPLVVQLVLDWMLNNNDKADNMPESLKPPICSSEWCNSKSSDKEFYFPNFTMSDIDMDFCSNSNKSNENCYSTETRQYNNIYWLPTFVLPHPDSRLFMLPPGGEKNVTIAFLTNFPKKVSTVLYIRNNLTLIETLRLNGEGVIASLKFGNRKPGSATPLLFDITEKHLKDCDRDKNKKVSSAPNFTVKRTFVARNTGVIPVKVVRFFINSIECEGYGFKVLNCESFELLPNGTHKVDIAFTPDFTLTKIQRLLILETSLTDFVNYTLVSSIPVSLASKCAAILRRPPWEVSLHNLASSLLIGFGFIVLFAGCYESYRILTFTPTSHVRETNILHTPFDLKAIGQMGLNKKPESFDCCPGTPKVKIKIDKCSSLNYSDGVLTIKTTTVHSQKCEDTSQGTTIRNRKKLSKKNSSASETTTQDLNNDHDVNAKEKRSGKDLNNHNSGKSSVRNSMENALKINTKSSLDSNETSKTSSSSVQDTNNDKNTKPQEFSKKTPSLFNINDGNDTNSQHNYLSNNKKQSKSKSISTSPVVGFDEDTSSTTTESSNNDEGDKENDNLSSTIKTISNVNKKSHTTQNNKRSKYVNTKDMCNGDGEEEDCDVKTHNNQNPSPNEINQKSTKNKESTNNSHASKMNIETDKQKTTDQSKSNMHNHESTNVLKPSKKETNKTTQKKERQLQSKKRSLEKSFVFTAKLDNSTNPHAANSFNIARSSPSTPPAISSVWENRASFSDVVARTDNCYSNNFVSHHKENQETRKLDQKSNIIGSNIQNLNMNKYSNDEIRKPDPQTKSNADLGPIGSNFYSKKSNWSNSLSDNQPKSYISNIQPNTSHVPNISDEINPINNNNSYFLNSAPYYNNKCLSDLDNKNMSAHGNNQSMNYGTIGSGNIPRMQYNIGNPALLQSLNQKSTDNMNVQTAPNMNAYDSSLHHNYGIRMSSPPDYMLDFPRNSDLINLASNISLLNANDSQMTSLNSYDQPISSWDRMANDSLNTASHVNNISNLSNNSMFETDYDTPRTFYDDNKMGWGTSQNVWDHMNSTATTTVQNSQILTTSNSQVQDTNLTNTNTMSSSDRGPAEWLWGYDNNTKNNNNNTNSSSLSTTNASSYSMNQYSQSPQISPQQNMNSFDSFRSLSNIWSNGSPMDLWTNQQNYDGNIQDLNNHSHTNPYQ